MGLLTRYIFVFFCFESYSLVIFGAPSLTRGRVCHVLTGYTKSTVAFITLYYHQTQAPPHSQLFGTSTNIQKWSCIAQTSTSLTRNGLRIAVIQHNLSCMPSRCLNSSAQNCKDCGHIYSHSPNKTEMSSQKSERFINNEETKTIIPAAVMFFRFTYKRIKCDVTLNILFLYTILAHRGLALTEKKNRPFFAQSTVTRFSYYSRVWTTASVV
jgi:hypothetical protein